MHSNMRPTVNVEFHLVLTEAEARALFNISGWSSKELANALLTIGGDNKERLRPALESLFNSTGGLGQQLKTFDEARAILAGTHRAKPIEPETPPLSKLPPVDDGGDRD